MPYCVKTPREIMEMDDFDVFDVAGLIPGAYEALWDRFAYREFALSPEKFKDVLQRHANRLVEKYQRMAHIYDFVDFYDFSTTKYRRSHAVETESTPDGATGSALVYDGDSEISIGPLPRPRYITTRTIETDDSAGSSGLSTMTNLDDVNHFFQFYESLTEKYAEEFEKDFMPGYRYGCFS